MRHRLTIWQPAALRISLASHYLAAAPTAASRGTKSSEKIRARFPVSGAPVMRENRGVYVPSGNSTCVRDIDLHRGGAEHCSSNAILPGHNRAAPAAEQPANHSSRLEVTSWVHREELLNEQKKKKKETTQ